MIESAYFHVGIVVPDIVAARKRFVDLLGIEWGPIIEREQAEGGDAEPVEAIQSPFKLCYSTVPPHLELIEEIPGSQWVCNEHSNLHHIGFWSDAVDADAVHWASAGCPRASSQYNTNDELIRTYQTTLGVRLELVSTTLRSRLAQITSTPPGPS